MKSSASAAAVSEPWSAIAHSERRRRRSYISVSLSLLRKACLNLWSVAATVKSMFTPTHIAVTTIRRLVENGGPQPRTRTARRTKRV